MDYSKSSRILYLLLISLISAVDSHNNTSIQPLRIINGHVPGTPVGYVVSIQIIEGGKYKRLGAGAIISVDFVITAAHVVDRRDETKLSIQAGVTDLSDTGSRCGVLGYKVHEDYLSSGIYDNDIAIIKVTPAFVLNDPTITVINYISTTVVGDRVPVVMSGWGTTNLLGLTLPIFSDLYNHDKLHAIRVRTISNPRCQQIYSAISSKKICTESSYGGACKGDGGGPVTNTAGTLLIGLISNGPSVCARVGYPDIHTRISEYNAWITTKMTEVFP